MTITTPLIRQQHQAPRTTPPPPQDPQPGCVDYLSQGVGVLGGAIQVVLKTPRNALASWLLPPRRASQEEMPALASDPALKRAWGVASAVGGAVFLGTMAGLCLGGPIAVVAGAAIGAWLFHKVDEKLADKARADGKNPVFVDGALAKGHSLDQGASSVGVWSDAFSTMSQSSYIEVRDWYSSKIKESLKSNGEGPGSGG